MRWIRDGKELYSPGAFIPVAESSGYILTLGDYILETALSEMGDWLRESNQNTLGINLSQAELNSSTLSEKILSRIDHADVDRNQIELELSERLVADAVEEHCMETIFRLESEGVTFSFDDFGTGQSSLMHLSKFPSDTLKIDKSFIDDIVLSSQQQRLVSGMIEFSHHLKMKTVAEGVETKEQRDLLVKMQCDLLQGYYISRPMTRENVIQFLRENSCDLPTLKLAANS